MKTAKEIANLLADRALEVARHLLPNGKINGKQYETGDIYDTPGRSLSICVSGSESGVWKDFAVSYHSGDLLNLWALVRYLSIPQAINEAEKWLGISMPPFYPSQKKQWSAPVLKATPVTNIYSPVQNYLVSERKLDYATLINFKVHEKNNEIIFPSFHDDDLVFMKYLKLDREKGKKEIRSEKNAKPILFGWQAVPPLTRKITICEGEIDAMTLSQYEIPALSIPLGADNCQWIDHEFDRLSAYDEIYLCFDNDEAGKKGVNKVIDRLGRTRCKVVTLPYKDANECLKNGVTKDAIQECFDNAKDFHPNELAFVEQFADGVKELFYSDTIEKGFNAPWKKTHGLIAFRPSELSIWSGINGHGKTQFIGNIILNAMKEGKRVCIASLEFKPERLLKRLCIQAAALDKPTPEYLDVILDWMNTKLFIFNFVGQADQDRLLDVFSYARLKYQVDVFVIDSFMMLDVAEDDYKRQKELINKLCKFKEVNNAHVMLVAHPRKGADEEQLPGKLDVKGSGCITDLADSCFTIWRNKKKERAIAIAAIKKEEPDEKTISSPDCIWYCDKQRLGDYEGELYFWFDKKSLQYLAGQHDKPMQYVKFSNEKK